MYILNTKEITTNKQTITRLGRGSLRLNHNKQIGFLATSVGNNNMQQELPDNDLIVIVCF